MIGLEQHLVVAEIAGDAEEIGGDLAGAVAATAGDVEDR
jgi:hypothetical protein